MITIITCSTLVAHMLYYTFMIGGDHFEYRVYSHLILFLFLSFIWLLNRTNFKKNSAIILLIVFIVLSFPVPWTHWSLSRRLNTREQTLMMRVPIANHWPKSVRWYASAFDNLQFWLIGHFVCSRHQEHKICHLWQVSRFPSRDRGMALPGDNYPVMVEPGVGVAAWTLPNVNILDISGLNDYVIARNPHERGTHRFMAHDRKPPEGYLESFKPNVRLDPANKLVIGIRPEPLTKAEIIETEKMWAEKIKELNNRM